MSDNLGVLPVLSKYINNGNFKKIYKDNCNFKGLIFRAIRKSKTPLISIYFDDWKKEIDEKIKNIIILDSAYNPYAVKILRNRCKKSKIILYHWNHINPYSEQFLKDKNVDEFWTFDPNDAKKYNMNYNPQFYTKKIILKENDLKYDLLFLGRAKNRKKMILDLDIKLKEKGINSKNIIIENEKDFVPYDEYLKLLSETKAILDIVDGKQVGLTLRCMEALFFNKKLITNNLDIVNYDFYNQNNIFILGKDDMRNIKEFINSPYEYVDEKIINYYDFEEWIKRFNLE